MSAVDAAQEILRREQASPGSVPAALLAKAKSLAGGGPEFTGTGTRTTDPEASGGGLLRLGGHLIQAASRAGDALDVGASEFANALTLGGAGALDPMFSDPRYAAAKQEHPVAALGGQVAGLTSRMNPANMAAGALAAPLRDAIGGSMVGRAIANAVEGATGGGLGAGTITAAGGGSGDQIFNAATTGAGVGGALGAGGSLLKDALQAPGQWVRSLVSQMRGQGMPAGAPAAPGAPPGPLPEIPELQVPPKPDPVPSAAPHEPLPPEPEMSTVHRPRPGDTGMGAEEARRALDSEALHMANRTAAVQKILGRLPDQADSAWLAKMSQNDRQLLAKYAGVTQANEDTWRAVGDALDARMPAPAPHAPEPGTFMGVDQSARGRAFLENPPEAHAAALAGGAGGISPGAMQMGLNAIRGRGLGHGPLGIDPMLGMLLQSPAFARVAGTAAGTKLPAAMNRQPGQPIDLLNLYGM